MLYYQTNMAPWTPSWPTPQHRGIGYDSSFSLTQPPPPEVLYNSAKIVLSEDYAEYPQAAPDVSPQPARYKPADRDDGLMIPPQQVKEITHLLSSDDRFMTPPEQSEDLFPLMSSQGHPASLTPPVPPAYPAEPISATNDIKALMNEPLRKEIFEDGKATGTSQPLQPARYKPADCDDELRTPPGQFEDLFPLMSSHDGPRPPTTPVAGPSASRLASARLVPATNDTEALIDGPIREEIPVLLPTPLSTRASDNHEFGGAQYSRAPIDGARSTNEKGSRRDSIGFPGGRTGSTLTITSCMPSVPTTVELLPALDSTTDVSRASPALELELDGRENMTGPSAAPLPAPNGGTTHIRSGYRQGTPKDGADSLRSSQPARYKPADCDDGLKSLPDQFKELFPLLSPKAAPKLPNSLVVGPSASRLTPARLDGTEALMAEPTTQEITEYVKAIVARLTLVFADVLQYRRLLNFRDSEVQHLLDTFQMLLDTPILSAKFKRSLIVATQRLSKGAGLYPTCYHMKEVELASEDPVATGGFADIYKGRLQGQTVCLKVIRFYQTSDVNSFLKHFSAEAILWSQLSHPNLLPIHGLYRYKGRLCLISPWMEHGDINRFLQAHPGANRSLLVSDVASGVAYLHENEIIHGDLKGNVMINESGRACLADFGVSAVSDKSILNWTSNSSAASKGGTTRYQAPELFDIEGDDVVHNTKASDVYAFACVAYEIFTGNKPFFEIRDEAVILKIIQGVQPSQPSASSVAWGAWGLTKHFWWLMETCWSRDPALRPTIHHVAQDALKKCAEFDFRPVGNANTISPSSFRDAQMDLPSVVAIETLLDAVETTST